MQVAISKCLDIPSSRGSPIVSCSIELVLHTDEFVVAYQLDADAFDIDQLTTFISSKLFNLRGEPTFILEFTAL